MTKEALAGLDTDVKSVVKCKNMFALGMCLFMFNKPLEHAVEYINNKFGKRNPVVAEANVLALKAGHNYAHNTHAFANTYDAACRPAQRPLPQHQRQPVRRHGGFIAASERAAGRSTAVRIPLPPRPSFSKNSPSAKTLGVKTVQCEDEIAGICTTIGASYAGHFAVTTTSGPGLSLKSEAMGLAVMTELPIVVVDVQRGGPPHRPSRPRPNRVTCCRRSGAATESVR